MHRLVNTLRSAMGINAPTSSDGVIEEVGGVSYDLPSSHPQTVGLSECEGCAARDTCEAPDLHEAYPSYLTIDRFSTLYGHMKPITRHAVVSSGISARRWPTHVEKTDITEAEQIANANASSANANDTSSAAEIELDARALAMTGSISRVVKATEDAGKWLVCSAERRPAGELMIFPEYKMVSLLGSEPNEGDAAEQQAKLEERIKHIVQKVTAGEDTDLLRPIPYRAVILICAHKRRDKRCGVAGPILHRRFIEALEERQKKQAQIANAADESTVATDESQTEEGDIGVFMVSHTGGHKFAGNVLVYPSGIWYGRVTACHVDAILEHTVFNNQVIRELYRGRLNPPTRDDSNF
ncbi:Sucrase/ferredoxin-like-domain-containing protein [Syncephalis fuscata]|nr:Sucrase/ferredoxin-like-domain-containing protein [Syncephalis fuscata]